MPADIEETWTPVIFSNTGSELYAINKALIENETYAGKGPNEHVKAYVKGRPPFQEVDQNLVWPDEALLDKAKSLGWSKKSIVADPVFDKKNPQWDVTYRDYQLKTNSPAFKLGFKAIDMESIGLRQDFPFDRSDFFLKVAAQGIQAEDYDRMRDLRAKGNTGINTMKAGAWAKYANVDFGDEGLDSVLINAMYGKKGDKSVFELRLDSPEGKLIGTVNKGDTSVSVIPTKGRHNLFLVFKSSCELDALRFTRR